MVRFSERVDWNDLRYLLAVERWKTLAAAAKHLRVTKATVSRRLAALERAVGARLFERKPGGLVLTVAGSETVKCAEGIDLAVSTLEERVAGATEAAPKGTVRLTAPPWLASRLLIPSLPELKERFPELDVQLVGTNQILNLAQREADLALRNVRPEHRSLVSKRVGQIGGCVYASTLYLDRRGTPESKAALSGHDVLVYEGLGGMPGFEWLRDGAHKQNVAFRANDPEALVSAATAGLGLTAVPCLLGDAEKSLRRIPSLGFARCDLFLVSHEESRATPRVRAVVDFLARLLDRHRSLLAG